MRLPDFVVIGAMKAATSTLHDQLARQPGVFMSAPKEPCFFSDDEVYARGLSWYASLFERAREDDLCGESSTHYTKLPNHPHAAERLARLLPDAKLIYVMRDPLDRLVSHFLHCWSEREVGRDLPRAVSRCPELVHYGCYAMQLAPYLGRFGPDRVLPVFFERLQRDPQAELERIGRFLGHPSGLHWNPELLRNRSSERLRRSRLREALSEHPAGRFVRAAMPPRLRTRVRSLWTYGDRPRLEPAARRHVVHAFDADLAVLGRWLGRDLSASEFASVVSAGDPPEWTTAAFEVSA